METYFIIMTLNGNLVLKPESKLRDFDSVELEIYAESLQDARAQFNAHKKQLKKDGLYE